MDVHSGGYTVVGTVATVEVTVVAAVTGTVESMVGTRGHSGDTVEKQCRYRARTRTTGTPHTPRTCPPPHYPGTHHHYPGTPTAR